MITLYRAAYHTSPRASDFVGVSSDEKPIDVENGSTFTETDTGNKYQFDAQNVKWIKCKAGSGGGGESYEDGDEVSY